MHDRRTAKAMAASVAGERRFPEELCPRESTAMSSPFSGEAHAKYTASLSQVGEPDEKLFCAWMRKLAEAGNFLVQRIFPLAESMPQITRSPVSGMALLIKSLSPRGLATSGLAWQVEFPSEVVFFPLAGDVHLGIDPAASGAAEASPFLSRERCSKEQGRSSKTSQASELGREAHRH